MPRRYRPERREVTPDPRYNNKTIARFINRLMRGGKKSVAQRVMYDAFDIIESAPRRTRWRSSSRP